MAKVDDLRERREKMLARLNAKISEEKRREDSRARKEDTRQKILIGASLLLAMAVDPAIGPLIETALSRFAVPRDLEFLRKKGWRI